MPDSQRITLTKRQARLLSALIERWRREAVVAEETAAALKASYEIQPFNWARLARVAILTSVICFVVALASFFADEFILQIIKRLFGKVETALCIFFAVVAAAFYTTGLRRRKQRPERVFTNEGLLFLGVLSTAASISYLGEAVDIGTEFRRLLLLACVIYGALGLWARSKLIWVFALLSLGGWFGAETGYDGAAYYLGMGYPLRFVLLGLLLSVASLGFARVMYARELSQTTFTMGMLYLFIALWLLSIFGNHGDVSSWEKVKQRELFQWSLLFGLAAAAAIWHGLKFENVVSHGFGVTFLFINVYTRFFEYFWDEIHKAIFFAILGISLWFLGTRAQTIWNLGRAKRLSEAQQ